MREKHKIEIIEIASIYEKLKPLYGLYNDGSRDLHLLSEIMEAQRNAITNLGFCLKNVLDNMEILQAALQIQNETNDVLIRHKANEKNIQKN